MAEQKTMFSKLFRTHGQFCASRPWEVIIGTLMMTVCIMSMNLFTSNRKVCGWNIQCADQEDDTKSSDLIILTLTRCLAVICIYRQVTKLRRLGSKYMLGMVYLLTMCASFIFSIGIANILGSDLTGLNEALPFFFLLVDFSKACMLTQFALSSRSQEDVIENVSIGMTLIGPQLTLDTLVETLVIGVGMLSGLKTLETMCCFGCLSVIANYFAFMVFYPACLALVLELTRASRSLLHVQQLTKVWEEEEEKPNPITQIVKVIMCGGLAIVYARNRLLVAASDDSLATKDTGLPDCFPKLLTPDIPLWRFCVTKLSMMSIDYFLSLILAIVLILKYILCDSDETEFADSCIGSSADLSGLDAIVEPAPTVSLQDSNLDHAVETESSGKGTDETNSSFSQDETTSVSAEVKIRGSFFIDKDVSDDEEKCELVSKATQTENMNNQSDDRLEIPRIPRSLQTCLALLQSEAGASSLTDEEALMLIRAKHIRTYNLERVLENHERGVSIRRRTVDEYLTNKNALENLPYTNYNYEHVFGACCENVIGYVPVPVGMAGPLLINGRKYVIPMATTEGCLVASTNRGCQALSSSGAGVTSIITHDGMTRAPLVRFLTAKRATEVKLWLEDKNNFDIISEMFDSTSRFARLARLMVNQAARTLHIRFVALTGDAMGMNMLSKGCEKALNMLKEKFFPDMEVLGLSGNFCTDKKPCAVNWIEGRGKSVVAEARISKDVIKNVLKTSVSALVDLNINKNLIGSVLAGSIGGFNAQAANIVAAIFIATGQDPAQVVCSSNCITIMEHTGPDNEDLYISCTMPSIEVGTVGGGTVLPPQAACLEMLGIRGSNNDQSGLNARTLATIVCSVVMAGELSLMSALTSGDLVKSHLKHNRSMVNMAPIHTEGMLNCTMKENGICIKNAS